MYARLLRDTRFAKLLGGQSVSELGSAVTQIALPTVAVLVLHATPFELGILIALQRIPFPILAVFVGVWIDRLPRRRVMIAADILRAVVLAAVPIGFVAGFLGLPLLYGVALASGVLTIFFDLAFLAYVPEVVGREHLGDANATLQMSMSVASLAGPGLGGLLIQAVGAARAVGIDAASFVVSFLSVLWMGGDAVRTERKASPGMLKELREGFAHVFANPTLRTLIVVLGLVILGSHMSEPNFYPFAYSQLHLSPATVGWILSSGGAGAIVGSYLTPFVTRRFAAGWILAVTGVLSGAAVAGMSFAGSGPAIVILVGASVLLGLTDPMNNVTQWSLRQLLTPDHLQGRMNSIFRTVFWGAWPLANLIGGYLGSLIGPRNSIFAAGVVLGVVSLAFLAGPLRKARVAAPIAENVAGS